MPEIKNRDIYYNRSGKKVAVMTYEELIRYTYEGEYLNPYRLEVMYKDSSMRSEYDNDYIFIDFNKVKDICLELKGVSPDNPKFDKILEQGLVNDSIDMDSRSYLTTEFEYKNQKVKEEIELGDKVTVHYTEPRSVDEKAMLSYAKDNVFFKSIENEKGMKFATLNDGTEGIVVGNIFFDKESVNYYLDKYPLVESNGFHNDPVADNLNRIKAMENAKSQLEM